MAKELNRDEDMRIPSKPGQPPRPATEPEGAEHSTKSPHTETDPVTGEPNPQKSPK
jgi:hypothetical protein